MPLQQNELFFQNAKAVLFHIMTGGHQTLKRYKTNTVNALCMNISRLLKPYNSFVKEWNAQKTSFVFHESTFLAWKRTASQATKYLLFNNRKSTENMSVSKGWHFNCCVHYHHAVPSLWVIWRAVWCLRAWQAVM